MKAFPLLIFPLLATPWIMAKDLPPTITLRDGRVLEGVTAMAIDAEKVKITHSGGISRHDPKSINPDSQKALGLEVTEQESAKMQKVTVIKTLDGTIYEGVRAVRIKPSFVSFVYRDGAKSLRFEVLDELTRKQCGYDPALAAEFDKQREKAEVDMAKLEAQMAATAAKASIDAEYAQMRQQALMRLEFVNFGSSNYWGGSSASRGLRDAAMTRSLQNSGFSSGEANFYINRAKFR